MGRLQFGVMDVDTRSSGPNPYANYAVVRLKESLWGGSYIGVTGIDKQSGSVQDSFNQTGGVDTRMVFFKDWFVDAHMAGTQSPGYPSGNSDLGASLSYKSNWLVELSSAEKSDQTSIQKLGSSSAPMPMNSIAILLSKSGQKSGEFERCNLKGLFFTRRRNIKGRPFWSRVLSVQLNPSRKDTLYG